MAAPPPVVVGRGPGGERSHGSSDRHGCRDRSCARGKRCTAEVEHAPGVQCCTSGTSKSGGRASPAELPLLLATHTALRPDRQRPSEGVMDAPLDGVPCRSQMATLVGKVDEPAGHEKPLHMEVGLPTRCRVRVPHAGMRAPRRDRSATRAPCPNVHISRRSCAFRAARRVGRPAVQCESALGVLHQWLSALMLLSRARAP